MVGMTGAGFVALPLWLSGLQFNASHLVRNQAGPGPQIVLLLRQHMPHKHRQLARHGDGGHLMTAFGSDADEERL